MPRITATSAVALALILAVASCGGSERKGPPLGDTSKILEEGTRLQAAGKCGEAIPYLYHLAAMGQGFEIAQYRLARCLLAEGAGNPGADATLDGLVWMRRAAAGGLGEAQGDLAILYLEGPPKLRDPVEAAMWLSIYESNGRRHLVGFTPLPVTTVRRLHDEIGDATMAEGQRRANAWRQIPWNPPDRDFRAGMAPGQRASPPPPPANNQGGPTGTGGREPTAPLPPLLPQQ